MPRTSKDYMPRPDGAFDAWATHYLAAIETWWLAHGLDGNDLKPLQIAAAEWQKAYPAHVAAQAAAEAARQAKDAARAALQEQVRPITNFVQSYPKTTDADRATIGITVRDRRKTPSPTPTSRPLLTVNPAQRLTHELRLVDETSPTRRGKPRGVDRAEVYVALTAPGSPAPADPGVFRYIGSVTRGETSMDFEASKGGMQAHYIARWVAPRGGVGPWSDTASATVAA